MLLISLEEEIATKKFIKNIIIYLLSIIHFFACFNSNTRDGEHELEQEKSWISIASDLWVIQIFGVAID